MKRKSVGKNTLLLSLRMLFLLFINLYASRITLDYLGVVDFGVYNLVAGIIVTMGFINNSMALSANRFLNYSLGKGSLDETRNVFNMSLNLHVLIGIVAIVVGETIGLWFVNTHLIIPDNRLFAANVVYQISIVVFVLNIVKVPYTADIIAHEDMGVFAYLGVFEGIGKLLIVYLLSIIAYDKLVTYSLLLLLVAGIVFAYNYFYCHFHYEESKFKVVWSQQLFKDMSLFAGYSTFGNMATSVVAQGQSILLNLFYGPTLNAVRALSLQVNSAICGFMQNIYTASNPQITQSFARQDWKRFNKLIFDTSLLGFYILFVIAFPMILETNFVIKIWLKNPPQYLSTFIRLSLVNSLVFYLTTPSLLGIQATGNVKKTHLWTGCINLMNLSVVYFVWHFFRTEPYFMILVQIIISVCMVVCIISIQQHLLKISACEYFTAVVVKIFKTLLCALPVPIIICLIWNEENFLHFISLSLLSILISLCAIYCYGIDQHIKEQILNKFYGIFKR